MSCYSFEICLRRAISSGTVNSAYPYVNFAQPRATALSTLRLPQPPLCAPQNALLDKPKITQGVTLPDCRANTKVRETGFGRRLFFVVIRSVLSKTFTWVYTRQIGCLPSARVVLKTHFIWLYNYTPAAKQKLLTLVSSLAVWNRV